MRVWLVDPFELDNQRLLAQHQEVHALVRLIKNRMSRNQKCGGTARDWASERGLQELAYLHEQCVEEMEIRFIRTAPAVHATPISKDVWVVGDDHVWPPDRFTDKEILADVGDLQVRMEAEEKYFHLKILLEIYGDQRATGSMNKVTRLMEGYRHEESESTATS